MVSFNKLKPAFWDHAVSTEDKEQQPTLNFQRKWKLIVLFTTFIALLPLFVMTIVDYNITRSTLKNQTFNQMANSVAAVAKLIHTNINENRFPIDQAVALQTIFVKDDLFVVNDNGTLLTNSRYFGSAGTANGIDTGFVKTSAGISEIGSDSGQPLFIRYQKIEGTDLIVMQAKPQKWFKDLYFQPRLKLAGYLAFSIALIILSILWTATYLVGRIHRADQKRLETLRHIEYTNKLAAIGRLASGVAHEINNPLAIINEKTGLILDVIETKEKSQEDKKIFDLAKDVTGSVERCGTITRRLLDFARYMDPCIQPVDLEDTLSQILVFFEKEANESNISIKINLLDTIENFESDRGSLQQIFVNLIENSMDAMTGGGTLEIDIFKPESDTVRIVFSDTGSGIPAEELHKIFEPFYSSKNTQWGGGLGLSIIYGLTQQLNGDIKVESNQGQGTRFLLTFPLKTRLNEIKSEFENE